MSSSPTSDVYLLIVPIAIFLNASELSSTRFNFCVLPAAFYYMFVRLEFQQHKCTQLTWGLILKVRPQYTNQNCVKLSLVR